MKNSNKVLYSVSGKTAILTINRPERRNALDAETLEQINIFEDYIKFQFYVLTVDLLKPNMIF